MKTLLIEPHYLGCLEYFTAIRQVESVLLDVGGQYIKQTYRNRTQLLGSNKIQTLSIPVKHDYRSSIKDVKIDYSQNWIKDHWGALYSAYGKAPYFEFFADDLKRIWDHKHTYLIDLNVSMLNECLKMLQLDKDISIQESLSDDIINEVLDLRNLIHPKITFADRNIYTPTSYSQLFGHTFVPNLSIIDLIMCEGPQASEFLTSQDLGQPD